MYLDIYKRRMRIFRWSFVAAIVFVVALFCTHLGFMIYEVTLNDNRCEIGAYLTDRSLKIDNVYHMIRGVFLILLDTWLVTATSMTFSLMKRNSTRPSEFTKEICAIGTAYWTFVVCYAGWLGLYIFEFFVTFTPSNQSKAPNT